MTNIVLRRHSIQFYLSLLGRLAFFGGVIGVAMVWLQLEITHPFIWSILALAIATLYIYYRKVPVITTTDDFISFRSQSFAIKDISEVIIGSKRQFLPFSKFIRTTTVLYVGNQAVLIAFDDMYENIAEMKSYLHHRITHQPVPVMDHHLIDPAIYLNGNYEAVKGSLFLSQRGILFCLSFILLIFSFWTIEFILIAVALIFLYNIANMMYYVELSDQAIVVSNHIYWWKKAVYPLAHIKEIAFEYGGIKQPYQLRITDKHFVSKAYQASTLYDNDWKALEARLEATGVSVRNELSLL